MAIYSSFLNRSITEDADWHISIHIKNWEIQICSYLPPPSRATILVWKYPLPYICCDILPQWEGRLSLELTEPSFLFLFVFSVVILDWDQPSVRVRARFKSHYCIVGINPLDVIIAWMDHQGILASGNHCNIQKLHCCIGALNCTHYTLMHPIPLSLCLQHSLTLCLSKPPRQQQSGKLL